MKKYLLCLYTLVALSAAVITSTARAAEEESKLKINGRLWSQLSYDATTYGDSGKTPPNTSVNKMGFDIYRAYFIANYKFDDLWSAYLLTDASRTAASATTANQIIFIKDMFIQNNDVLGADIRMRFGYFHILYSEVLDSMMGTRWLATDLNDTAAGGFTIAGAGATGVTTVGLTPAHVGGVELYKESLGKILKYAVAVHNGVESVNLAGNRDSGLSYMATVDIMPFANGDSDLTKLGLVLSYDYLAPARIQASASATPTNVANVTEGASLIEAALHYQSKYFDGAFEFATQTESFIPNISSNQGVVPSVSADASSGWGVIGNIKLMEEKFGLYAKYNTGTTQFQNNKLGFSYILDAGPTWTFSKGKIMTGLIYEVKGPSQNTINSATATSNSGLLTTTSTYLWKWAANF